MDCLPKNFSMASKNWGILYWKSNTKLLFTSTVKTLSKLFLQKIENLQNGKEENNEQAKSQILNVMNNLYSIIDKAVKKGVLHKNAAARKKSKISLLSNKVQ